MFGLSDNNLGALAFLVIVGFLCLYSTQSIARNDSRRSRSCPACGRHVGDTDHICPHCTAQLDGGQPTA